MGSKAIRGAYLTYKDDPFLNGIDDCMVYESDGIIILDDGKISNIGPAAELKDKCTFLC